MPLSSRSSTVFHPSIPMDYEDEEELEVVEEVEEEEMLEAAWIDRESEEEDEEMLEDTWVDRQSEEGGADGISLYSLAVSDPDAYRY